MSGFQTARLPWLINAAGAPVGVKEADGDETMIPRFSADLQSLLKPDGSALAGTGGGGAAIGTLPIAATIASLAADTVATTVAGVDSRVTWQHVIDAIGIAATALPAAGTLGDSDIATLSQAGTDVQVSLAALKTYFGGVADTTAPALSSAQVANAAPTIVVLTFNETLAAFTPAASAFTPSGSRTVTGVARGANTISVTVNTPYANGDNIQMTYVKPGTNAIQDATGNQTNGFGPTAVTNNIAAPGDTTAPTASSAAVANSTPTIVTITASEALDTSNVPPAAAFTVSGHTVSSVAITGSTINLTCSAAFVNGEAARTVAYAATGTNNARDLAGNQMANFSALAITNNVAAAGPTPVAYRFNGPGAFGLAPPTTLAFNGSGNAGFDAGATIMTAAGVEPDLSAVDMYAQASTSSTVMPRPNDSANPTLGNRACSRTGGVGNAGYNGQFEFGGMYIFKVNGGNADRFTWFMVFEKGANPQTATPIWAAPYDGNHTGTPSPITMTG